MKSLIFILKKDDPAWITKYVYRYNDGTYMAEDGFDKTNDLNKALLFDSEQYETKGVFIKIKVQEIRTLMKA